MILRQYYEAYDDRYRQVHGHDQQWASDVPSAIVGQVMDRFGITEASEILELGCGEGRDALHLLDLGYRVTATDISPEAISWCRRKNPRHEGCFRVVDCVAGELTATYDFIYAVAVIHMLVEDAHRACFYRFIHDHLADNGLALICTMGDGTVERKSDTATAFELQERTHGETGTKLCLARTSCAMVSTDTFLREIRENALTVAEHGLTSVEPDFPSMLYAVVKRA